MKMRKGESQMKKNNPRIKKDYRSLENKMNAVETIVDSCFRTFEDADGTILTTQYTPYFKKIGQVVAIVNYFLEGIELDEEDGLDIYHAVMDNKETRSLIDEFFKAGSFSQSSPASFFKELLNEANDIVEYRKAMLVAEAQNKANAALTRKMNELLDMEQEKNKKQLQTMENLNAWIEEQQRLNSLITPEMQRDFAQNFDAGALVDAVVKKYGESDLAAKNREIADANLTIRDQQNKIIELQNEFAKEKQKELAKGILDKRE